MNRLSRKLFSLLAIGALLFAQLAVSAYACPMQFLAQDASVEMGGGCEESSSVPDVDSRALCHKHCENAQQNVNDTFHAPIFFAVETGRAVAPSMITSGPIESAVWTTSFLSHPTSPPHAIRNCCFRI